MTEPADEADELLAALDPFERRFLAAYVGRAAGNGSRAMKLAGHTGSLEVRATQAWRLLKKADVQRAKEALLASDPLVMTELEGVRFLTRVVRGKEPEATVKDRLMAHEQLAKLRGAFVAKVAATNSQGEDVDMRTLTFEQLLAMAGMKAG